MFRRVVLTALFFVVAGPGCRCDEEVQRLTFVLQPSPRSLVFGDQPIQVDSPLRVTVTSVGTGAVILDDIRIEGPDAGSFLRPGLPTDPVLGPGESQDFVLRFHPQLAGDFEADLLLFSNADSDPLRIPMRGTGKEADIVLCHPLQTGQIDPTCADPGDPLVLDFGDVVKNTTGRLAVLVRNVGEAELRIDDTLTGPTPQTVAAGFQFGVDLAGQTIVVGGGIEVPVSILGTEQGVVTGQLVIASNDLDEPVVYVDLVVDGKANVGPTACAVVSSIRHQDSSTQVPTDPLNPEARPADRIFFDAHPSPGCSSDPEDGDQFLAYAWTLVSQPANSSVDISNKTSGPPPGSGNTPAWLDVGAIGAYVVELVVTDLQGVDSAPAQITINAIPKDDITLEVSWDVPVDLDTHLIAPGGTVFCSPLDCFWDTCMNSGSAGIPLLDWGDDTTGDGKLDPDANNATDPILVFDNVGGTVFGNGSVRLENVRLQTAPIVPGSPYRVGVHYFDARGYTGADFEVTVKLVYKGTVLLEETQTFAAGDVQTFWLAGEVDVENGTTNVLGILSTIDYLQPPYGGMPIACP